MKKIVKVALWIPGCLMALVLVVLLFVVLFGSSIAKSYIEKHSPELLGRQIVMDDLSLNLFKTSVRIEGLRCSEADMKEQFLSFDTLYVDARLWPLLRSEVRIDHILLSGLHAAVRNEGETFNFTDLIERFSSDEPDTIDTPSDWKVYLNDIRLRDGEISYVDRPKDLSWTFRHLNIDIPGLAFDGESTGGGISFNLLDGGHVAANANYGMQDNHYQLQLNLQSINLQMFQPFVTDFVNLSQLGGLLSADINLSGNTDVITDVDIAGTLRIDQISLLNQQQQQVLSLNQGAIQVNRINPEQEYFDVQSISIDGLQGTFELYDDGTSTIDRLLKEDTTPVMEEHEAAEQSESQKPSKTTLIVRESSLQHSSLTFVDNTLFSPMSYTLSDINAKFDNLSLDGTNDVSLMARLPEGGTAIIHWIGGLDFENSDQKLSILIRNLQLKHFSPYAEYYVGNPLEGGNLSLTSENKVTAGQINGTNSIDIYNATVGKKNKQIDAEYKAIPLRMAIGLLKDINGKIAFNVPVKGDLNNPEFSYGKIVWKTISNLLVKATASPFVSLGRALGMGNSDALRDIKFDPLHPDFTSTQYDAFAQIASIMNRRSDFKLVMTQQFNLEQALAQQALLDIKSDYYRQQHQLEGRLSPADEMVVMEIKDKELNDFTSELQGKNLTEKALLHYGNELLQQEVMQRAEMRQRILTDYFVNQMGLSPDHVVIQLSSDLSSYNGKSVFEVSAEPMSEAED